MVGMKTTVRFNRRPVIKAADKAAFRNIFHAAASIRKIAGGSIERSKEPSLPGKPPHTKRGLLKRALRFQVAPDKQSAVIGPRASIAGQVGAAHELGGSYKGQTFKKRPFMEPALKEAIPRFAGSFRGSIG